MNDLTALREAFARTRSGSKHACYQEVPALLAPLLAETAESGLRRYERARLNFMLEHLDVADRHVLDIGCNSGFFLLEMLAAGARHATGYEGSAEHARFLGQATQALELQARLQVHPRYFDFEHESGHYDVALLLNVLHHVGDDYGDPALAVEDARAEILRSLRRMREHCDVLVFQLGFNWKGDRHACLFEHGTIEEMVAFVSDGTRGTWQVQRIAVAERGDDGAIAYRDLDARNRHRKDELGEFLNRPLFILT
jgi:SAM-dependent methyltransferase